MKKRISGMVQLCLLVGGMLFLLTGCGGDGDEPGAAGAISGIAVNSTYNQATLSWRAPVTRVNGDVLSGQNLASYEIRYGTSADNLSRSAVFDGAAGLVDMSYTIENLSAGTWYFTIQAKDDNGLLSSPSAIVSKNIPA
ncbi:MAG: fibronectin type III domain-containing protein [Marinobacter sp.]